MVRKIKKQIQNAKKKEKEKKLYKELSVQNNMFDSFRKKWDSGQNKKRLFVCEYQQKAFRCILPPTRAFLR